MVVNAKEVLDFAHCPMMYKYKYKSKSPTMYLNLLEKYDQDIHKFMYAYHSHLQNDDPIDSSTVKRIWGTLWIGAKNKQQLIFSQTGDKRDTFNEKRKLGISTLITYHNRGNKIIGSPILVNHEYKIQIDKGLYLQGNFELIQQLNNKVQLINFKSDTRNLTKDLYNKELETTIMSYAFRETFQDKEDMLIVYAVDKNRAYQTYRTQSDFNLLKYSIKNIALSIKNNLFYAAPSSKCVSCIYRDICDNYILTEKEN